MENISKIDLRSLQNISDLHVVYRRIKCCNIIFHSIFIQVRENSSNPYLFMERSSVHLQKKAMLNAILPTRTLGMRTIRIHVCSCIFFLTLESKGRYFVLLLLVNDKGWKWWLGLILPFPLAQFQNKISLCFFFFLSFWNFVYKIILNTFISMHHRLFHIRTRRHIQGQKAGPDTMSVYTGPHSIFSFKQFLNELCTVSLCQTH